MRDPFIFGDDFYGDLDCRHRGEEKIALRLKVIEVGRNVCFGGKGGGSAPTPDPNIGKAALMQAEIGQGWLDFATEQFQQGNIRQEALDALNKRVIEQQLATQDTTNQWARSDRQRYESTFRPLEDMMVLDAYGASNMTDDQLRQLLGQQNAQQRAQLEAEHKAKIASIRALASEKETLTRVANGTGGGVSPENAQRMAETILRAEGNAPPNEWIVHQDPYGSGGNYRYKNREYDQQMAEYQNRVKELSQELASGSVPKEVQELVRKYTDQDIQSLIEAETAKYEAALGNIGANEEAIFAQRRSERLAQDNAAAEAKADVSSAATQERQATQRQMASMGLNPTSGRYQGVDRAMGTATALASAGAQTNARRGVTADTRAARANAVNVGSGLPASAAGSFGLGLNAGNSATGNAVAGEGNWRGNVGIMSQGYGGAMQGYAGMGNTLQQQYNSQLNAWAQQQQANAASAAGLFGALGTGIGAYAAL